MKTFDAAGFDLDGSPTLTDDKGNFSVCIWLRLLLGFFEDFKKVIINTRGKLLLFRSHIHLNMVCIPKPYEKPIVQINKIIWKCLIFHDLINKGWNSYSTSKNGEIYQLLSDVGEIMNIPHNNQQWKIHLMWWHQIRFKNLCIFKRVFIILTFRNCILHQRFSSTNTSYCNRLLLSIRSCKTRRCRQQTLICKYKEYRTFVYALILHEE